MSAELDLLALLGSIYEALGLGGLLFCVLSVGAVICWVKGKPLISLFTGNGYIRQKDYDEDMQIIRDERAHTREKLDAVARDLNELTGYIRGRTSKD